MRVIWGFMLENTYFTEFDLSNHRIIEGAYRQRKTRQTSHYINIRDSHLPVQARVYFGVEQIHLRMPGTRYYVKRIAVSSPSPSCIISATTLTPSKPRRQTTSRAKQANNATQWPPYSLTISGPMAMAPSSMCAGRGSTTTTMVVPQSNPYLASPLPPAPEPVPSQSMLMPPPHSQAPFYQTYGGLCSSSSSTSTCTSGSSTPGSLGLPSTAGTQTLQPPPSADIFQISPWQQIPSQSTSTNILLDHLALTDKSVLPPSWQQQQHSLLTGTVDHSQPITSQLPTEMQPMAFNNDTIALAPWILDDVMCAFGGTSYLMPHSIQSL